MKNFEGFEQIGLTVDKKHQTAFGVIEGYRYFINYSMQSNQYSIVTTVKKEQDTGELNAYLNSMDKGEYITYLNYNDNILMISLKNNKQLTVWELDQVIKNMSLFLQTNGYLQCCRHCGQFVDVNVCSVEGHVDLICSHCFQNYEATKQETKPANLPLGIIGALLGSLVGVLVWVIIYKFGFIAGISGFVMSLGCLKGYELLGGRLDKKGIIIGVIIAIVMLFVAEMVVLVLEIQSLYAEYYDIGIIDAIESIPFFLEEGEIVGIIFKDLAIGYFFMIIASFTYIRNEYRAVSVENVIERL